MAATPLLTESMLLLERMIYSANGFCGLVGGPLTHDTVYGNSIVMHISGRNSMLRLLLFEALNTERITHCEVSHSKRGLDKEHSSALQTVRMLWEELLDSCDNGYLLTRRLPKVQLI